VRLVVCHACTWKLDLWRIRDQRRAQNRIARDARSSALIRDAGNHTKLLKVSAEGTILVKTF
jgi:hypothetical protein